MKRRKRARSGFIIIFGWRVISSRERKPEVRAACPGCDTEDARLVGRVRRKWFTLFFLPVFPIDSAEHGHRVSECRECKQVFDIPIEQFARRAGARRSNSFSDTIVVYNQLRENPADGATMLKLLKMYDELKEPGEAEAAARHYPNAVAAEPECAVLLERMRRIAAK